MIKYLFIITISPVQTFIAQARKTHDLYAGSRLLSDLVSFTIGEIKKEDNKAEFIFPSSSSSSNPNRIVCIISSDTPKEFGNKVKKLLEDHYVEISTDKIKEVLNNQNLDTKVSDQIQDFLQVTWVMEEYKKDNYKEVYEKSERFLGAVKNLRAFKQLDEEPHRKCSLCGERNAYFYSKSSKPAYSEVLYSIEGYRLIQNEGLCSICFSKRLYLKEEQSFESTAQIALLDTLNKFPNKDEINKYWKNFQNSGYEAQIYYEDNLTEKYLKKHNIKMNKNLEEIIKDRAKLEKTAKDKKLKFSKYYAVLAFDGDSIGKWLSGEYKKDEVNLLEFHKALSKALAEFASESIKIVETNKYQRGKVIYAGGDDFLGFINLNHIFDVMQELRDSFDTIIKNNLNDKIKENQVISFSAGVVIAHYKMPLGEIIKTAKNLVSESKSSYNGTKKDSFGICVLKNSGEISKSFFKWAIKNEELLINPTKLLTEITNNLLKEKLSNNYIKTLNAEFSLFESKNEIDEMLKVEIERLLNKSKLKKDFNTSNISKNIFSLYQNSKNIRDSKNKMNNFLSCLNICNFISRELNNDNN